MPYALGVDIGTSTLTTATYRPGDCDDPEIRSISLESDGPVSTAVAITGDGRVSIGKAADREAAIHPERCLRAWSGRIGDAVPIAVGDALIAPEAIFAAVVRWAVLQAEKAEGAPPVAVGVSHPTGWGEHRVGQLKTAIAKAGIGQVTLVDEVDAVVSHHSSAWNADERTVGVCDLGADRHSFSLLTRDGDRGWTRLAAETLHDVGGNRFDDAVLAHVVSSSDAFAHFDTRADGSMSYLRMLRNDCSTAKSQLSSHDEVSVPIRFGGAESSVRVELLDLRTSIEDAARRTALAVHETHRRAERDEAATTIVLVGGSSRSPLLRTLLAAELDSRIVVDDDPQTTVAFGAARLAAAQVDWSAPVDEPPLASGSRSALSTITRAYGTTVRILCAVAQKYAGILRGRAASARPSPDSASTVTSGIAPAALPESSAPEFDRLIAEPGREPEYLPLASDSRERAAEATEVSR